LLFLVEVGFDFCWPFEHSWCFAPLLGRVAHAIALKLCCIAPLVALEGQRLAPLVAGQCWRLALPVARA
ncbi:hypothetical protein HAX54_032155, partial [Datura stramonium]|nr:hypothetical protein [Datura stramonium]